MTLFILLSLGLFFLSLSWIYRLIFSKRWIQNNRKIDKTVRYDENFYVLIPVFNEEEIIRDTCKYFLEVLNNFRFFKIVFITTEKEEENTILLVNNLVSENANVIHYHCTNIECIMAHQLNFAINEIRKVSKKDFLLVVYNADSRPPFRTFEFVFSNLEKSNVFQQYGNYSSNIKTFSKGFISSSILYAASAWQNRWSLGIELFRSIKQMGFINKPESIFKPLNCCIGHGLFITSSTLKKVGGFCEETHNEDSVLGFFLGNLREVIYPIPYFDYSESTNELSALFFQKTNWFFGPGQFIDYFKLAKQLKLYKTQKELITSTVKMFFLVVYWLFGPLVILYLFISSLFSIGLFLIFIFVYMSFLVVPNFVGFVTINKLDDKKVGNYCYIFIKLFVGSLGFYLMHGASGYIGLYKYIFGKITNKKIEKGKTYIRR